MSLTFTSTFTNVCHASRFIPLLVVPLCLETSFSSFFFNSTVHTDVSWLGKFLSRVSMTGARCSLPSPVLFGKCEKASRLNEVCLRWLRYQSGLSCLVCLGLFSLCQRLHADMSFCIFLHRVSRIVMARSNRRVFSFSSIKFMIHLAVKNVTEQFLFSFVFKCLWVMGTTLDFICSW